MLSGIGTLIAAATALFAIFKTYPDWKKQEIYKTRAREARDILACYYEGQQVIDSIRAPFVSAHELSEAEKVLGDNVKNMNNAELQRQSQRIAALTRINRHTQYWEKLFRLLPIAKAVFGDDEEKHLMDILKARQEIFAAAETYPNANDDLARAVEGKLWKGASEPDSIQVLLDESASALRNTLSEYLRPENTEP